MAIAPAVWVGDAQHERHLDEWPGDEKLAEINKRFGVKAPKSIIIETDVIATAWNRETLGSDVLNRIVKLNCGHMVITKNAKKVHCGACQAMIDRGADWDLFVTERGMEV